MDPIWSPNDPLFFLHHTFIDYMWWQWEENHPNAVQYDGKRHNRTVSPKELLKPWDKVTVESTLDTKEEFYCYTYKSFPRPIFSKSATNTQKMRVNKSIQSNPFFNGFLKGATMSSALELLRDRVATILKTNPNPKSKAAIVAAGPFSDKWIKDSQIEPIEFRKNADDSTLLAQLINQLPEFESISSFRHYFN